LRREFRGVTENRIREKRPIRRAASHASEKKNRVVLGALGLCIKAITDFAAAINCHEVEKIAGLMSDDHTFIDADGNEMIGKETMKAGWTSYFQFFPDYYIEIEDIFIKGDLAMAFGHAGAG
jgi:hypothetical protein